MADTNRVRVSIVEEQTRGVTPATPVLRELPVSNAGTTQSPTSTQSRILRADRQRTDTIQTGIQAGGDLNSEMMYGSLDDVIRAAMCAVWTEQPHIQTTAVTTTAITVSSPDALKIKRGMVMRGSGFAQAANNGLIIATADGTGTSVAVTGTANEPTPPGTARLKVIGFQCAAGDCAANGPAKTLTISATSGSWTALGLAAGDWIKIGGEGAAFQFATAATNGYARVASATATVLTLDIAPTGFATDTGATKTIRITIMDRLRNGTAKQSFTIERYFEDIGVFEYFRGMMVQGMRFTARPQDVMQVGFSFQGEDGLVRDTIFDGATRAAVVNTEVMNTGDNMGRVGMGGAVVSEPNYVMEANFAINNNIRGKPALGYRGFVDNSLGEFAVEGTLETYFGNKELYERLLNNEASSFDFTIEDNSRRGYVFDMPRIKFKSGSPSVPGSNQDVMLSLGFDAVVHPTLGYTLQISRFSEAL